MITRSYVIYFLILTSGMLMAVMNNRWFGAIAALAVAALGIYAQQAASQRQKGRTSEVGYKDTPMLPGQKWRVHDLDRPRPRLVTPAAQPGMPPSDAVVLFAGKDLSKWL